MSSNPSIFASDISKTFWVFKNPLDRFKHLLWGGHGKSYGQGFHALQGVSLKIERGETLGIIGRNGSGKSTLLQILCGTLNQSSGTVERNGRLAALLELGSGFNPEFTGRENVYLNGSLLGLTSSEISSKFDDIARFADIGEFMERPVKTYSSGMYVRLAFSVIAHVEADILIIDEALAVGDAYFTQKCMRFLREFKKNGTLIFVSHDSAAVTALCDKALWLKSGRVALYGNAKAVSEAYLADFYDQSPATEDSNHVVMAEQTSANEQDFRYPIFEKKDIAGNYKVFCLPLESKNKFGKGGASFTSVYLKLADTQNERISFIKGGELVTLALEAKANEDISEPIVGFSVKDKLGQVLFGENTFISHPPKAMALKAGAKLITNFSFRMPILPPGEFSISVALANGTQKDHIQHEWVHDAIIFHSITESVASGLVGIPMLSISVTYR